MDSVVMEGPSLKRVRVRDNILNLKPGTVQTINTVCKGY